MVKQLKDSVGLASTIEKIRQVRCMTCTRAWGKAGRVEQACRDLRTCMYPSVSAHVSCAASLP